MTELEKQNLKAGDKLYFFKQNSASLQRGDVVTFLNWVDANGTKDVYFQCEELLVSYPNHACGIFNAEVFNPDIHKNYRIVNDETLLKSRNEFIEQFGDDDSK